MQRVITVSLNRNAYHFDEDAHRKLTVYLDDAARVLARHPDRAEVLADIEQAIADRCSRRLEPGRTVISLAELEPALVEIGPVEVPAATAEGAPAMSGAAGGPEGGARPGTGLRQVSEGAWISGVCNGIARGAGLDVTLVRVIAVLLLFVSGGAMMLLYAVLMLLLPYSPVDPQAQPLRWLPAKSRELVLAIRAKLSALMG